MQDARPRNVKLLVMYSRSPGPKVGHDVMPLLSHTTHFIPVASKVFPITRLCSKKRTFSQGFALHLQTCFTTVFDRVILSQCPRKQDAKQFILPQL